MRRQSCGFTLTVSPPIPLAFSLLLLSTMRRQLFTLVLALLFLLSHAAAQNPGSDSRGPDSKKDSGSVVTQGAVRVYEPGKFLDLDVRPMVDQKFDLTSTSPRYVVEDGVKVGSKVEVESKSDGGQKTVTIRVKR
jgi:hypothetical protein